MEYVSDYGHALAALALFGLVVLFLGPLSAMPKEKAGMAPGATPQADYNDPGYRMNRAYLNGTESLSIFGSMLLVAVLAGANPQWVNWLASVVLLARIVQTIVHVKGIGRANRGPRTVAFVIGFLSTAAIGVLGIFAVFSG